MQNGLAALLTAELKDLYSAEKQILRALPKIVRATTTDNLREALEEHFGQTEGHVERLEEIFGLLGMKAGRKKCKGMEGLLEEGEEHFGEQDEGALRDAAIIAAAQRVEHYEIAAYGTALAYAQKLGYDEAAELLEATLAEERTADERLSEIAEGEVNQEALAMNEEGEEPSPPSRRKRLAAAR
jgi:ferritin-like metal-binding protein YciE